MSYERDQDPMDRPPLPPEPDEFRRRRGRDGGGGGGKPRSRALPIFIALFALGAFGGIVWYAYTQGVQSGVSTVAPVIKAEDGPTKAKPEQPGGLQVPHQDKQVFQRLLPEGQTPQTVERLLPPPPEPLQPPPAPEPAAPSAEPVQPLPSQTVAERPVATPQPAPQTVPQGTPPVPSAAPAPQPPQDAPAQTPPAARAPAPQPAPQPAAEPKPEPKAEPKPTPAPAQTQASIAAVSGGGFKVQLAAVRSDEAAKQEWNRLKTRYKEELGALSLTVQRVDLGAGKGVYHRIQAGPLDEAAAERACTALKAKNQACLVVRP
ncbi:SPOR domain-containing protein [Oceanibaculum nanhaiense]|uniref:SPOR domain-containing protein n=1 Tax=Oceanibaculum nanhaiense TaxID=1909734 RepID=UPI00396D89AC